MSYFRQFCAIVSLLCLFTACQSTPEENDQVQKPDPARAAILSIRGQIVWPDSLNKQDADYAGTPLSGFRVSVYRLGDNLKLFPAVGTDDEGRFFIRNVEFYPGEQLSIVVSRNERRYALADVVRVKVGQRSGPTMADLDTSKYFNVIDTSRTPSGRYNMLTFVVQPKNVKRKPVNFFNRRTKTNEKRGSEVWGTVDNKEWRGLKLNVLPLLPKNDVHWSDGTKIVKTVLEKLDVNVGDLPEELYDYEDPEPFLERLDETYILDEELGGMKSGAMQRTGVRRCDLRRLSEHARFVLSEKFTVKGRELRTERFPFNYRRRPFLSEEQLESLKERVLLLSPGHGFYLKPGGDPNKPESWVSPRTFMSQKEIPGLVVPGILEDDLTVGISRRLLQYLEDVKVNVVTMRELRDVSKEGLSQLDGFQFKDFEAEAGGKLPRLWEQNAKYALAAKHRTWLGDPGDPRAIGRMGLAAPYHPGDGKISDNARGVKARVEWARRWVGLEPVDALLSVHTNATGMGPGKTTLRGSLGLFLDVQNQKGENANKASEKLSAVLLKTLYERAGIPQGKNLAMTKLGRGLSILRDTYPHFYKVPENNGRNRTALFERIDVLPQGAKAEKLPAAEITAETKGWHENEFPQQIPTALIEVSYHDHPRDAELLQYGWFQRRVAKAMLLGLARFFEGQPRLKPSAEQKKANARFLKLEKLRKKREKRKSGGDSKSKKRKKSKK